MRRIRKAAIAAAVALSALAAAGCTTPHPAASSRQPEGGGANASATTHARFVGYKWLVTSITSHGKQMPMPDEDLANKVYVLFTPNGQFAADDPINIHEGHYRLVGDGFTTNGLIVSAVGYAGNNPVMLLAINAISAFNDGVHAAATVTGNRLDILSAATC